MNFEEDFGIPPTWKIDSGRLKPRFIKYNYNLINFVEPRPRFWDIPDITDRMREIPSGKFLSPEEVLWRKAFGADRVQVPEKKAPNLFGAGTDRPRRISNLYELLPNLNPQLQPDVHTTMKGSRLPSAKEVLTELLADPKYISEEARAVVEAYQKSRRADFYYGLPGPRTLRQAVEQRFDAAIRQFALGISSIAYDFGVSQLSDPGSRFTVRDAAVTMRAGIDRVDLCFDQLYRTLIADKFMGVYVAAVLPRAEKLLRS